MSKSNPISSLGLFSPFRTGRMEKGPLKAGCNRSLSVKWSIITVGGWCPNNWTSPFSAREELNGPFPPHPLTAGLLTLRTEGIDSSFLITRSFTWGFNFISGIRDYHLKSICVKFSRRGEPLIYFLV